MPLNDTFIFEAWTYKCNGKKFFIAVLWNARYHRPIEFIKNSNMEQSYEPAVNGF